MTVQPDTQNSVFIMARTLYGEARGAGAEGMKHVAMIIMNRVHHPRWWGRDVVSVCQAPWQFSCWNKNDPNLAKIEAVTEADGWFAIAVAIATQAIEGKLQDVTGGADSYFARSMPQPPSWAARATKTYQDAWHAFYRVELAAPDTASPEVPDGDPHAAPVSAHSVIIPSAPPPHEIAAQLVETPSTEDLNSASLARAKQGT